MAYRLTMYDELNLIGANVDAYNATDPQQREKQKQYIFDEIEEMLILAYIFGTADANEQIGTDEPVNYDGMTEALNRRLADGLNWRDRVENYLSEDGSPYDIMRVAETETTRIYNDAVLHVGNSAGGATKKTWRTMEDDRVRAQHEYLNGMTIPISGRFYTFDGDSARYPSDFTLAQNNVNCRCVIELSR